MAERFSFRAGALVLAASALLLGQGAQAQRAEPPVRSGLDAQLFYQLLIGEIEFRSGEAGNAYGLILDAARRTKDEQLFKRATDIALQARAGDQALAAARSWRAEIPTSLDAHRYEIQLLIALNRAAEAVDPMRSMLQATPEAERPAVIMSLPRFFVRSPDRQQVAVLLEQVLKPYADQPSTRAAVNVALGRAWLVAENPARALELARAAHTLDPSAEGPALLALELLPGTAAAEAIVRGHLQAKPDSHGLRLMYVRTLSSSQRYADAITQLEALTARQPEVAAPWITLGALHLELKHPREATAALQRYVELVQKQPASPAGGTAGAAGADAQDEDAPVAGADRGLTQAWLMLAQAAEQQGDFKAAENWLKKVDSPQRALEVQSRRASLMARQGKLKDGRELIRRTPERGAEDVRAKLMAEVSLLRDAKQWGEANTLLADANVKYPNDVDLLYEQSMMAEKLNKVAEMERLLRKVIELKPDHHHAYNALGYSLAERNVRLPEAKALIQKALDIAPGEPFITDSLGWVEYRIGNREEALRLLRGAYQSRPDPEIAAHLGEVLWVSGQRDEARKVWREARSRDSSNDVLRETLARLRVGDL